MASLTKLGALGAATVTVHTALNARLLRVPPEASPLERRISILVPARNEAERIETCLRALLVQQMLTDWEILVLDDCSDDSTAAVVRRVIGECPHAELIVGAPTPPGWLGKAWACAQLAASAHGEVLVFVDADVRLAPDAVARAASLVRPGLELVSPYPRLLAVSLAERLIQPLLAWSWLSFLPLRLAERSPRPSLTAAAGQFLVVDAAAYQAAGGHSAVRTQPLEDIWLLRNLKHNGAHGVVVDGSSLASCRMYAGWGELRDGYAKSLWSAFGSPAGAAGVAGVLSLLYVAPAVAALRGKWYGFAGYAAGVAGRAIAARRMRSRAFPDSLAHPISVIALVVLLADSFSRHQKGELSWKGRVLP